MKKLEDVKITEKYMLRHLEVYEKGYLAGYVQGILQSDGDFRTCEEYEVLYRIHDTDNGNDYTLVSVVCGWKIGNDDVIRIVEEKLTEETKKLNIDFELLEKAQADYKNSLGNRRIVLCWFLILNLIL